MEYALRRAHGARLGDKMPSHELRVKLCATAAIALLSIAAPFTSFAQDYRPPRTSDGKPDLQGFWTNSSVTDLERPAHISKLVLTAQEAAEFVSKDELVHRVVTDAVPTNPNTGLL